MNVDLAEPELWEYRSTQRAPDDFDSFWADSLANARRHPLAPEVRAVETGLTTVEVFDVAYAGFGGERIRAWLKVPRGTDRPLPTVVEYAGYGGGRGPAIDGLLWASAGFAHLRMDTRGQGAGWGYGETPDPHGSAPSVPGFMTRGILDRDGYYYRRLFVDACRAIDLLPELDACDPTRAVALGGSQGGGIALAATTLVPEVAGVFARVPFLCDLPRALAVASLGPYTEVQTYLSNRRAEVAQVMDTLAYIDGVNFARRASVPAWFSTGLADTACPPSTVFGAFHAYAAEKTMTVWAFNGHEGGGIDDDVRTLDAVDRLLRG